MLHIYDDRTERTIDIELLYVFHVHSDGVPPTRYFAKVSSHDPIPPSGAIELNGNDEWESLTLKERMIFALYEDLDVEDKCYVLSGAWRGMEWNQIIEISRRLSPILELL